MEAGWNSSFDKLEEALAAIKTVRSADGTLIAFRQTGSGPTLILVTGALGVYSNDLAAALSGQFTVINYARRGRGDSGDTLPYAVQREIEDIEALVDHVGGSAYLFGISSGAALSLEAANALPGKIRKVVAYEPPFIVDDTHPPVPEDYVQQLQTAVAEGRRGDAVEIFMVKAVGVPQEFVDMMRNAPPTPREDDGTMQPPPWSEMEAVAHTLAYDGMVMGQKMSGKPLAPNSWPNLSMPVLFVTGGNSGPFFANGAQDAIRQLPNARHRVLEGQDHAVSPSAIAPLLIEFFSA
jgi:pimeloyl-ACP methyl ester carboxylesterase